MGDNRKFSTSVSVTSRIKHQFTIDLTAAKFVAVECRSDESENAAPNWANEGKHFGQRIEDKTGLSMSPIPGTRLSQFPDVPRMKNDYSQPRKHPRKNLTGTITPYREDGDQAVDVQISYAGKNFAFYGSDTDLGHKIFGGDKSDGGSDTGGGSWKVWESWNGIVPDLDVTHKLSIRIGRTKQRAQIASAISGDGFPNCESFMIDDATAPLVLGTHIRMGTAATQLPGGRALPMTRGMLEADWNAGDLFGSNVKVQLSTDYTGDGGPNQIVKPGSMPREHWNLKHVGRDASGDWLRQVEDMVPIPRQTLRGARE